MSEKKDYSKTKENLVIGLTLSRLLLASSIAKRTREGKQSVGRIGLFVGADIADGVLARRWGVDTPLRRAVDAITDRASAIMMAKAVFDKRPDSRLNLGILAGRELVVATANATHLMRTGEVVQGHGIHKLGSLSVAGFGAVAGSTTETISQVVGATTNAINAGLAIDYISNAVEPHGEVIDGVRHIQFDHLKS
jgi:phosphatidylglycerophosphate synthase